MPFAVSPDRLDAAERALGRRLPAVLRERLLRNNGGEILCDDDGWQLHPVWDDSDRRTAARTTSHIIHETNEAKQWPSFPVGAIAVASNGTGDLLIVRADSDVVELWSHETGECVAAEVDWE
jgi:hypothetical protein